MRNKKLWKQLIIATSLSVAFASTSIVVFASDPTDEVVEFTPQVSSETKAPKTGDTSSALLVAGVGLASLGVALTTILRKRK